MLAEFNHRQCNATRTHRFTTSMSEGKRALLGFRDDTLIGYIWWHDDSYAANDCYLSRFGVALAEGEVYGDDLFIAPEHRGHGTPAAFVAAVEAELVRLGYRRMYGFVDSDEHAGPLAVDDQRLHGRKAPPHPSRVASVRARGG